VLVLVVIGVLAVQRERVGRVFGQG